MKKAAGSIDPKDPRFPYGELFPTGFFAPDVESNPYTPNIFTRPVPSEEPRETSVTPSPGISEVPAPPVPPGPPEPLIKPEDASKKKKRELYVLKSFAPTLPLDMYFPEAEEPGNMDGSFMLLEYLKSVGYKEVGWIRGPEFKETNCHKVDGWPICTVNLGLHKDIESLLRESKNHSEAKGYSPPKPIIYLSHPNCGCGLRCYAPRSVEDIPDSAPGIPLHANDEIKKKYKEVLYHRLRDMNINRWSALSQADLDKYVRSFKLPFIYKVKNKKKDIEERELLKNIGTVPDTYASNNSWNKAAIEEGEVWTDDIRPIALTEDIIYFQEPFILQPIPKNYVGFQLEKTEKKARIFLPNIGYEIEVPKNVINYLELRPSKIQPDANVFISIEGDMAIIIAYEEYEKSLCYIPSFKELMFLDGNYTTLEILN